MQRSVFLAVALAILAAGLWWLLRPSPGPGDGDGDASERAAPSAPGRVDPGIAARERRADGEGVLHAAGRRRPEQAGVGGVSLRVASARDEVAVGDATVSLRGVGHAGEAVDLVVRTDARGLASFPRVPAGTGYTLRVDAGKAGLGLRPDVEVRAAGVTELGAVLVGEGQPVRGRVEDEAGRPLAGADVRAVLAQDNPMEYMANFVEVLTNLAREPSPLARTVSDADGGFVLDGVPAGVATVRATSPGRRLATARVEVRVGTPPPEVTLRLEPGSVIAGAVVGGDGAALPGATMAWVRMDDPFGFMGKRVFATTEAGGRFEVVLEPGTKGWRAVVDAEGYPVTISPPFAAGSKDVRIVLERGADLELTLRFEADRRPVVGATVLVAVGEMSDDDDDPGGAMPSAVTDAGGVVRLSARPGKVAVVMALVPGHGMLMAEAGDGPATSGLVGDVPKALVAGTLARATLTVRQGLEVTGVVSASDGAPLANCRVAPLGLFGGSGADRGGAEARTDATGRYRVAVPASGWGNGGVVTFQLEGYASLTRQVWERDEQTGRVVLDVTLRRAATLRGRVVDAAGQPVAGVRVGVEGSMGPDEMQGMMGLVVPKATTAADGSYVVAGLPPSGSTDAFTEFRSVAGREEADPPSDATTRLEATAEGFVDGRSEPVRVAEGAVVDVPPIRLSRGATLVGQVLRPDGRPAAAAKVEVELQPAERQGFRMRWDPSGGVTMGDTRTVVADAEGRFTVAACEVGKAVVVAHAPGAARSRVTATIPTADARVETRLVLRAAGAVSGLVLDPEGRPVRGARVEVAGSLLDREGDDAYVATLTATTGADGRFELEGLPDGRVTLAVAAASMQRANVVARVGGTVEVRLAARSGEHAARLAELEAEIAEVSQRFATAGDSTERQALQQRLMDLVREQAELKKASNDSAPPAPPSREPDGDAKCG